MKSITKTVVVGGSFAGLTAALELKRKGGKAHDVVQQFYRFHIYPITYLGAS